MKKQHIINETFLDVILAKKLGATYTSPKEINDPDFDPRSSKAFHRSIT